MGGGWGGPSLNVTEKKKKGKLGKWEEELITHPSLTPKRTPNPREKNGGGRKR